MPVNQTNKIFVIVGPTAVGKTDVSIALAQRLGTAIISADSRQCYTQMNIGTAKPTSAQMHGVQHYFIDEFPVTQNLSAADFEALALRYLDEIFTKHTTAVVSGGTGLYIKSLCEGLDEMPETDPNIAILIETAYKQNGLEWLQQQLQQDDQEFYNSGEIQNPARLMRALSFVRSTGKSITSYRTDTKKERPFKIVKAGLELPRELLFTRINTRVDKMIKEGLLVEAEGLYTYREHKNLQTVGYTEIFDHIEGKWSIAEAIDKIKQHTRNYAKRQMTWFKKDKEITWFNPTDEHIVDKILALQ